MMRTSLGLLSGVVLFASLGLRIGGAWADEAAPPPEERPAETQGGTDHPRFKRFPGSVLTAHEHKAFEEYVLRVAPDGEGFKTKKVEGKYWKLTYWFPKGTGALEVARNYEAAARAAGFTQLLKHGNSDDRMSSAEFDGAGKAWFFLHAFLSNDNVQAELHIVEAKPMDQQVTIDAAGLLDALNKSGRIAVYGVNFATSSAKINADSAQVLAEIGKLLTDNKSLKLSIEGHTDNVGRAKVNLKLSKARAASVKKWLVKKHDVASDRLETSGFGDGKPVADNETDAGRTKNRRVELVKR